MTTTLCRDQTSVGRPRNASPAALIRRARRNAPGTTTCRRRRETSKATIGSWANRGIDAQRQRQRRREADVGGSWWQATGGGGPTVEKKKKGKLTLQPKVGPSIYV